MHSDLIVQLIRLTEADIAEFEARMREVTPTYQPSERVELHGEVYEISSYQRDGMSGYWLWSEQDEAFIPIDQEGLLRPLWRWDF